MATDLMSLVEATQLRDDHPDFAAGDTVRVHVRVIEGDKERVQIFEGVVIAVQNGGVAESFTVRKISNGVGVERIFPFASPRVARIEVVRYGRVRRAKLYYLRGLRGKAARITEKRRDNRLGKNEPGGSSSSPKAGSAGRAGSGAAAGSIAPPNPGETKVTGSAGQKKDESDVPGIKN